MGEQQHYQMYIDGEWTPAASGQTFESVNPATGEIWSTVPEASADDVDRAVRAAHKAFTQGPWSTMTPTARAGLMVRHSERGGKATWAAVGESGLRESTG